MHQRQPTHHAEAATLCQRPRSPRQLRCRPTTSQSPTGSGLLGNRAGPKCVAADNRADAGGSGSSGLLDDILSIAFKSAHDVRRPRRDWVALNMRLDPTSRPVDGHQPPSFRIHGPAPRPERATGSPETRLRRAHPCHTQGSKADH